VHLFQHRIENADSITMFNEFLDDVAADETAPSCNQYAFHDNSLRRWPWRPELFGKRFVPSASTKMVLGGSQTDVAARPVLAMGWNIAASLALGRTSGAWSGKRVCL
jgi:hypothetical protein